MAESIEHVVRWWLTDPDDAPRFAEVAAGLAGLPGLVRLRIGTSAPVAWTGPDQSWDVGFVASFESMPAVAAYMAHPAHQAVVDLAREIAARVDVFYLN